MENHELICKNAKQCAENTYNKNKNDVLSCHNYDKSKCYTDEKYMKFYNAIDWTTFKNKSEYFMNSFSKQITQSMQDNTKIKETILTHYLIDLSENENALFKVQLATGTDNYNNCDDIVWSFCIEYMNASKTSTRCFRLFHIAMHSRRPIYVMGSTRSTFTCAFTPIKTEILDVGPFHYKIDNVELPMKDSKVIVNKGLDRKRMHYAPFKTFDYNNKVNLINNDRNFNNLGELTQYPDIHFLHKFIYKEFVRFWNESIFPDIKRITRTSRTKTRKNTPSLAKSKSRSKSKSKSKTKPKIQSNPNIEI